MTPAERRARVREERRAERAKTSPAEARFARMVNAEGRQALERRKLADRYADNPPPRRKDEFDPRFRSMYWLKS